MNDWIRTAIHDISTKCVRHRTYDHSVRCLYQAVATALPGEVIVLIGPSRVGKSSAIAEAIRQAVGTSQAADTMPSILVVAENASTNGQFSTKAFSRQILHELKHPIYGLESQDDSAGFRLDQRFHRVPEGMLHNAIDRALRNQKTRYVVVDETQHIKYARGGIRSAAAILDSWKCLAQKTGVVLILVGSYELLDLLTHVPHLLGRQHLVEFPRYRIADGADCRAFGTVLTAWSAPLRFESDDIVLRTWGRLLMEGSHGCVGQLSLWLRKTLAALEPNAPYLTSRALLAQRHAAIHASAIESEIVRGERLVAYPDAPSDEASKSAPARQRKPFQRASQRFPIGGRS